MRKIGEKKLNLDRHSVMIVIMLIVFGAIVTRLVYLQIFRNEDFKEKANTRSRRFLSEKAPRGKIYDDKGKLLATNKQTYTLTFTETDESNKKFFNTVDLVIKMLNENDEEFKDNLQLKLDENNELFFDFNVEEEKDKRAYEIRFKKDKGMARQALKELFPDDKDKVDGKFDSDIEKEKADEEVDKKLLTYTPRETFEYLIKLYEIYDLLLPVDDKKEYREMSKKYVKKDASEITEELLQYYTIGQLRNYIVIKDAIKMQSFSGFKPVTIASDIKQDTAFIFQQKLNDMPGIDVSLQPIRYYPYGELASSVLGYVSSINGQNKTKYEERGYDASTDLIGRTGIESAFESTLKGTKGGTTIKVNSAGRKLNELFSLDTYPGNNIYLTIDKDIQYSAERMLEYQLNYLQKQYNGDFNSKNATRGAVVALEAKTGRVLALASYPGYDPNIFAKSEINPEDSKKYFSPDLEVFGNNLIKKMGLRASVDELFPKNKEGYREDKFDLYPKPFYNYATMGLIPPGSTFKPVTAIAGLEEHVISTSESMRDAKYFDKYPEIFGASKPKDNAVHGIVDVKKAIEVSCNYFFYDTAIRMYKKNNGSSSNVEALNTLAKYAWKLGLGVDPKSNQKSSTGIEISENFGKTYNFDDFKELKISFSKWDLVNALEDGKFPGTSARFAPVDIGINDGDSETLASAKKELKDSVVNKLKEIGVKDISGDFDSYSEEVTSKLQKIYGQSDKYKESISKANTKADSDIKKAAFQIANWVIYSMSTEITSAVELANASIGQGMNNYTPIQLANYIATVASGGDRHKVHLVDKITDPQGSLIDEFKPELVDHIDISKETLNAVKQGMYEVNHGSSGTARTTFSKFPIKTAGKTGTATFRSDQEKFGRTDYATYVSFAPLDDPEIVVVAVMYDGGHGGLGAPIARAIYETYFRDKIKSENPGYKPCYYNSSQSYDFTLNPSTADIDDNGIITEEDKKKLEEENKKQLEKERKDIPKDNNMERKVIKSDKNEEID